MLEEGSHGTDERGATEKMLSSFSNPDTTLCAGTHFEEFLHKTDRERDGKRVGERVCTFLERK